MDNYPDLHIYNTSSRKIELFEPLQEGKVQIYTCGPTVYDYAHTGNFRTFIEEDVLVRLFRYLGYDVTRVMNITDVGHLTDDADFGEDKITKASRERNMSVWDIASHYTDAFFKDAAKLNITPPDLAPRATEHIEDMIGLIRRLEENGYTYVSGGNVYFDISKFPNYGKMALIDRQERVAGARIQIDEEKKNPNDFVLWFTRSKFEHQAMMWDSPWGRGYPGWHIECSAMSMKYLGEQFDIHCGGVDHIPVHHTNEIAQSEGATGKQWVRYWMHIEFLLKGAEKMSKSKGNFHTVTRLQENGYDPLDYRYFCLQAHYRSQLKYSEEALSGARKARQNLLEKIRSFSAAPSVTLDALSAPGKKYREDFVRALTSDLNTPQGLAVLWNTVKADDIPAEEKKALILDFDSVFGLDLRNCSDNVPAQISQEDEKLIRERESARTSKDYQRADEIRDLLKERGIILKDGPEGTVWEIE
ncbi:MAG: cysteine--tRNA ligase [Spirochaetia bacterium]